MDNETLDRGFICFPISKVSIGLLADGRSLQWQTHLSCHYLAFLIIKCTLLQ